MPTTAADVMIEALCDWGVEIIFGLPGKGINDPQPLGPKETLTFTIVKGENECAQRR